MSFNLDDKIKILNFYDKYGMEETLEAVRLQGKTLSNKSLYRWRSQRKRLEENQQSISLLAPKSRKPKNYKGVSYPPSLSDYVRYLRRTYPIMGKDKLKIFVDRFCKKQKIPTVSVGTIGNILKRLKAGGLLVEYTGTLEVYLDGSNGKLYTRINKQKKKLRKPYELKASSIGAIVQLDAVTIQVNKRNTYFINCIDLYTRKAYSLPCVKLNSINAVRCIKQFESILKTPILAVQTDNGLENHKYFDDYLKESGIIHYWNRPRSPKSNATIERFNRTIQEEFVNKFLNLCKPEGFAELEKKTKDYLFYYNSIRPHKSLQYLTPNQKYNETIVFSHM